MDLQMPIMDGYLATQLMNKLSQTGQAYPATILALTAYTN